MKLQPHKDDKPVIPKSRYDSVDCYISPAGACYNDVPLVYDEKLVKKMVDAGKFLFGFFF